MNSRHIEVGHITERNHQLMHLFNRLYCENIFALMKEKVFYFLNIKIYFRNKSKLVIKQLYFLPNKSIFNCRPDNFYQYACVGFFFEFEIIQYFKITSTCMYAAIIYNRQHSS